MNLVVFTYDYQDPRFHKRLRMFRSLGYSVAWLAYNRNKNVPVPPWVSNDFPHQILERTFARRYGKRLVSMLRTIYRLTRRGSFLKTADVVYCIAPDNLVTVECLRRLGHMPFKVVYELADVMPAMMSKGIVGICGRAAERWALRNVKLVTVSSPAYVQHYLDPVQHYRGSHFLLENKLLSSDLVCPVPRPQASVAEGPLKVGFFGNLKCQRSLEVIGLLAQELLGKCTFILRGYVDSATSGILHRVTSNNPNVQFAGPYRHPADLPEIYGQIDLCWGFDFCDSSHNSKWCLANRTYEAGLYCVPLLTQSGTTNGEFVDRIGLGWSFDEPILTSVGRFLRSVGRDAILAKKGRIATLDCRLFLLDKDMARLKQELERACGK